jgi:hypothetical protein
MCCCLFPRPSISIIAMANSFFFHFPPIRPTMESMATPTYTAKNLCLLFLHITIYTSTFLLLLIPMTQDPQSTTCIALRALGLALNFIHPALFSLFIKDQSYIAIEYMCFNASLISIVMTYSKLPLLLHKFALTSYWYSSS